MITKKGTDRFLLLFVVRFFSFFACLFFELKVARKQGVVPSVRRNGPSVPRAAQ